MEQETFFITEVASETEEKPFISNVHNRMGSHEKRLISNNDARRLSFQRLGKKRQVVKISIAEKRLLARLVEKEPSLWDRNNELHFHGPALSAAWRRISRLSGRDVAECKTIWKSLKDAVRYRKNKIARTADLDESRDEFDMDSNWEFSDCLSFLMDVPSSSILAKHPQRNLSFQMEFENSQTSETRVTSVDSTNISTSADQKLTTDCHDDTSASESSFNLTTQNKQQEDDPLFVDSMVSMANSIKDLAKGLAEKQDRSEKASLKFDYIWRNLDTFFQKLPPEDVDELNFKFIQMAYERIQKTKSS